jgi:hypothetical protein
MSKRAADSVMLHEMIDEGVAYFISMMLAGRQRILALLRAVEIVIASGLRILGVSAPQEMR